MKLQLVNECGVVIDTIEDIQDRNLADPDCAFNLVNRIRNRIRVSIQYAAKDEKPEATLGCEKCGEAIAGKSPYDFITLCETCYDEEYQRDKAGEDAYDGKKED